MLEHCITVCACATRCRCNMHGSMVLAQKAYASRIVCRPETMEESDLRRRRHKALPSMAQALAVFRQFQYPPRIRCAECDDLWDLSRMMDSSRYCRPAHDENRSGIVANTLAPPRSMARPARRIPRRVAAEPRTRTCGNPAGAS